ncbi:MAG TPA: ABC transporter permease [Chitinophagaceae bacterium]|nr:ABC transporter permease [Chitinophagaceae bacterium]
MTLTDQNEPFASLAHFTDPSFFEVFNFPLKEGTINLGDRSTVLITEKAAKKFYGNTNPIGKTLMFYSDETYKKPLTITGVLKDPPTNSSLQFEIITNFDNQLKTDGSVYRNDDWTLFSDAVFLKLSQPSDAQNLNKDFKKYLPMLQTARTDLKVISFVMEPLSHVANHIREIENNVLMQRPEDAATYGPFILGILILLSACLNFANTSVAQSNRRLKEIGVRKVMGSSLRQIMFQQLLECSCIVLLAIGLSAIINNFWLPAFNAMFIYVDITANYFHDYTLLALLGVILLGITLLAGAYPAFYISRFNAANIFRGSVKFGGNNFFSRIMLGLQIVISFISVIAGVAFSRNSKFQSEYDYGYNKENIIGLNFRDASAYIPVRDELSKIPGIDKIAGTNNNIGFSYDRAALEVNGEKKQIMFFETGENYLKVMNLKLVAGRDFNKSGKGDYLHSLLINEKLAFEFGWKPQEAIGKQIKMDDTTSCTVTGVLKDFTQNSLFEPIESVAMSLFPPDKYSKMIIHAKQGSLNVVYTEIKKTWSKLYPLKPFRAYYQDEVAAEGARVNKSIASIFLWFAFISVFIAATGMFALVSLSVLKKRREIAIRKVVGAGPGNILKVVLKGYSWIFIVASVIGCYAGYMLSRTLMNMIFRINAGVSISSILVSFVCVLVIGSATIGAKVWQALQKKTY